MKIIRVHFHAVIFIAFLIGLACVRFYRLSDIGIKEDDAVVYVTIIQNWVSGNFYFGASKPGYYLLAYLMSHGIGMFDDTTLYLNCVMDLAGIAILYVLAIKAKINPWMALSCVVLYAFLPDTLHQNIRGIVHLSTMAVTVASFGVFWMVLESRRWQFIWIWLCGFLAGFAGLTHPTAFGLVPIYAFLLTASTDRGLLTRKGLAAVFARISLYGLGVVSAILGMIGVLAITTKSYRKSWHDYFNELLSHHAHSPQGIGGGLWNKFLGLNNLLFELLPPLALGLILVVVLFALVNAMKSRQHFQRGPLKLFLIGWTVVLGYLFANMLVNQGILSRLIFPVLPIAMLTLFALPDGWNIPKRFVWFGPCVLVLTLSISAYHAWSHQEYISKPATIYRKMGEQLAPRLDKNNRLLMLPSNFNNTFLETLYLDARWVYRLREPWKPNIELLKFFKINHIMISKDLDFRLATQNDFRQAALERGVMLQWLKENQAIKIFDDEELLIYKLPYESEEREAPVLTPLKLKFYNSLLANYIGPRFYVLTKIRKEKSFDSQPLPASSG